MEEDPAAAYERLRDDYYEGMNSFEAIEGDKENVLPRRQGRRVSDLDAAYNSDQHEREQQRKQGHEAFLQEIESIDDLDDPLDVYIRYIQWTEANYPQGHNQESDLRGLLEETTGRFEKHTQYKNDARYLRCWIQYIQYADQPKQIYRDLMNKGIGQDLALFYETYADYLERCGEMDEASKVYKIGMEREAQPLNRLRRHHDAFENRRAMRDSLARSTDDPSSKMRPPNRVMLGVRLDARSSFSSTPRRLGVSPGIVNSVSSVITPARPFSVYTGAESSSSSSTSPSSSSNNAVVPNNTSASAIISHRIENQMPVDKFAGSTLSQKDYIRPPPSQFQVYRDQSTDQSGHHPHRTYQNSQELVDRFRRNRHIYIHSRTSNGKHEIVAATQECIRGGVVTSFEELRAHMQSQRRRMAKGKQKQVEEDYDPEASTGFDGTIETNHKYAGPVIGEVTMQWTEETLAAYDTITSLMSKNKDMSLDEGDESDIWTRSNQRPRRHVNENEDSSSNHHNHPAIVPVKKYGHDANRIPFMDVCPTTPPPSSPFFNDAEGGHLEDDEDDDEDDIKEMQRMQREVQEAEQRKRQRLEK